LIIHPLLRFGKETNKTFPINRNVPYFFVFSPFVENRTPHESNLIPLLKNRMKK